MTMEKKVTFNVFKASGHTMGTWKGAPIKAKAPQPTKGEVYQVTEDELQNNEEPMLPVILDDIDKKPSTDDSGPEILMPTTL